MILNNKTINNVYQVLLQRTRFLNYVHLFEHESREITEWILQISFFWWCLSILEL